MRATPLSPSDFNISTLELSRIEIASKPASARLVSSPPLLAERGPTEARRQGDFLALIRNVSEEIDRIETLVINEVSGLVATDAVDGIVVELPTLKIGSSVAEFELALEELPKHSPLPVPVGRRGEVAEPIRQRISRPLQTHYLVALRCPLGTVLVDENGSALGRENIPCGNSLHDHSVVERVDDGRDIFGL